jgi:hypothetical protein
MSMMKISITALSSDQLKAATDAVRKILDDVVAQLGGERPEVESWIAPKNLEYAVEFPIVALRNGEKDIWRSYGAEDICSLKAAYPVIAAMQ